MSEILTGPAAYIKDQDIKPTMNVLLLGLFAGELDVNSGVDDCKQYLIKVDHIDENEFIAPAFEPSWKDAVKLYRQIAAVKRISQK